MNLKELVKEERGARKERGEGSVQIIRYKNSIGVKLFERRESTPGR